MVTANPGTLDYITAVVVLFIAVLIAFSSAAVCRIYAKALRVTPRKFGILLAHICVVAFATTGTWVMLGLGQLAILGLVDTPRAARLAGYAIFGLLTLASLFLIGLQQHRRVQSVSDSPAGTGTDTQGS